jgi:hypothetical protein
MISKWVDNPELSRTGFWEVGKTTDGNHWAGYAVSRRGKWWSDQLGVEASKRIRFNFGAILGRDCTVRFRVATPAAALSLQELVCIALLEGRRSIQLSYGRNSYVDSKSFIAKKNMILARLPSADRADAPCN